MNEHYIEIELFNDDGVKVGEAEVDTDGRMLSRLTTGLVNFTTSIITSAPETLISIIVMIVSSFYIVADYENIARWFTSVMPDKALSVFFEIKDFFENTLFKIIGSYVMIMGLTFIELFIGLTVIGISNSGMWAFIISLLDILPILGVGTVVGSQRIDYRQGASGHRDPGDLSDHHGHPQHRGTKTRRHQSGLASACHFDRNDLGLEAVWLPWNVRSSSDLVFPFDQRQGEGASVEAERRKAEEKEEREKEKIDPAVYSLMESMSFIASRRSFRTMKLFSLISSGI